MDMAKHNQSVKLEKKASGLSREEAGKVVTYRILILVLADFLIGTLLDYVRADGNREYSFVFQVCPATGRLYPPNSDRTTARPLLSGRKR